MSVLKAVELMLSAFYALQTLNKFNLT